MLEGENKLTITDEKKIVQKKIVQETVLALVLYPDRSTQAEKLGITDDGLRWRLREYPEIKKIIAKIPEEALMRLQAGSIRAVEVFLKNLSHSKKDMEAAKEVLDRVGVVKKEPPLVAQQFNVGKDMQVELIDNEGKIIEVAE